MSLLEDSAGVIWVGTYGGGLSRYDRNTKRFTSFTADAGRSGAPRKRTGDGARRGWQPAYLGRHRWRRLTRAGSCHAAAYSACPTGSAISTALSAHTVYAIHVDGSGTVWVGTRGGGLDRVIGSSLEPRKIRFRNLSERDGLPNNTIYGIRSDAAGALWLSTNRGLARFDPRPATVRAFHRSQGLQGEEFNFGAHYANAAGELFFGGPNGYNGFDACAARTSTHRLRRWW